MKPRIKIHSEGTSVLIRHAGKEHIMAGSIRKAAVYWDSLLSYLESGDSPKLILRDDLFPKLDRTMRPM